MKITKVKTFEAYAYFNMQSRNCSLQAGTMNVALFEIMTKVQEEVFQKFAIRLPVRIVKESLFNSKKEEIQTIYFINHPTFSADENDLKEAIIYFTSRITELLFIKEVTLVLPDQTLLFEMDGKEIDEQFKLSEGKYEPSFLKCYFEDLRRFPYTRDGYGNSIRNFDDLIKFEKDIKDKFSEEGIDKINYQSVRDLMGYILDTKFQGEELGYIREPNRDDLITQITELYKIYESES